MSEAHRLFNERCFGELRDYAEELERENAALRKELEDVQLWLRNDRRNALARANHMEHLHVQTIDARLRDVNAAIDAARKESK